jgi:hypothetical protein
MYTGPITNNDGLDNVDRDSGGRAAPPLAIRPVHRTDTTGADGVSFGYLSAERPSSAPSTAQIGAAAALITAAGPQPGDFSPPPEVAAFVRLLSHDIALTAATQTDLPSADGAPTRADGLARLRNMHRGSIDLSVLYDSPSAALRDQATPRKLHAPGGVDADPRLHGHALLRRLQTSLMRLHNRAVDDCDDPGIVAADPSLGFAAARAEVRQLVQWLAMAEILPALCPPATIKAVQGGLTPMFTRMVTRMGGGIPAVPLEALAAALPLASLTAHERTVAPAEIAGLMLDGRGVALPSGQETVRAINRALGLRLAPLTDAELRAGPAASVMDGAMMEHTPLWLYLLREAEERGVDGRLGPVGGHLLAQTVTGMIVNDPFSYWWRPADNGGRWRPLDGVLRHDGRPIETIAQLLAVSDD